MQIEVENTLIRAHTHTLYAQPAKTLRAENVAIVYFIISTQSNSMVRNRAFDSINRKNRFWITNEFRAPVNRE